MRESSQVSYVGDGVGGLEVGDRGKVIAASGEASHVRWATGARRGQITLESDLDLVVASRQVETSFDGLSGSLVTIAVRDTFEATGSVGLLNALNEEGHLATFAQYAEEALQTVAARIRHDPSMVEVLAHLEPEEQGEFVSLAASVLLRDAFGGTEAA